MKPPRPPRPTTGAPTDEIARTVVGADPSTQLSTGRLIKTRADFRPEEFRKLIQQKGYYFVWRKAILCPCANPESQQPRVNCRICDSSGFIYVEPRVIQGVMMGLEKRKDIYRNLGEWLEGSAMVTVEPEHKLGFKDSLEMQHSLMAFNEWITKGNRRGIRADLPKGVDVARYRIARILHLLYEVDERPVALSEGVHFEITEQGWIRWLSPAAGIPDGTLFSINYEFHPIWLVITHPHSVRDTVSKYKRPDFTVQSLPIQATVKLDYLLDHVVDTSDVLSARGVPKEEAP